MEPLAVRRSEPEPEGSVEATLESRFRRRIQVMVLAWFGDPALAEDVAQETLRRVIEALRSGRLQNQEALAAFVYQTARHVCLQRRRKSTREERALGRLAADRSDPKAEPVLSQLIHAERRAEVRRALERLRDKDRALLRWLYYEGLDARVVAERLGLTDGALRVRRHRALKRLAELLGET